MTAKKGGLEGIIVGDTDISTVGKEGIGLTYRGYDIHDLAKYASFEEVAYLLIYGQLPNQIELNSYQNKLVNLRQLSLELKRVLEAIPGSAHPMDVLRTGTSMLGTLEPESSTYSGCLVADRLLACTPSMLLYWYQFHYHHVRLDISSFEEKTIAGYFLQGLHGKKPSDTSREAMNASLILYAEHELNASTFAARVAASTLTDFYSAIVAAIGTLRGPLHGGANEEAMDLISSFKTPSEAARGIKEKLVKKEKIMGFGHRVYKISDPRSEVIKSWSNKLSHNNIDGHLFAISESIEKVMWEEKKLFPNLDFYSATTYHFCHIPTSLFTPIFVLARLSGWSAHILEQRKHNRLIRPEANYVGPSPRPFTPIQDRGK